MHGISTIGYERTDIDAFIERLRLSEVKCILDVRDYPISRKKGFSKRQLQNVLENSGIRYIHMKALGNPKEGREAARAGNRTEFRRIYERHLNSRSAQIALDEAGAIAITQKCCLLCFERDPKLCHRNLIVQQLAERNDLAIQHIFVTPADGQNAYRDKKRRSRNTRQGDTASKSAAW